MRTVMLSSLLVVAVLGCSATAGNSSTHGSGTNGTGAGVGGSGNGGGLGAGGGLGVSVGVGGSTGSGCSAAAELVYVLADDNTLWSFDPPNKKFTKVGPIKCQVPFGAAPNSMAVDRNAVAWVNYVQSSTNPFTGKTKDIAGSIYKVSTADGSCEATPTITLPDASWFRLGMGFSTDAANATTETLYVAGTGTNMQNNAPGLGKIDMTQKAVVPIGQFTGMSSDLVGQSAELTGTGDARLFGFFTTTPIRVAEIDKTSGATPAATEAQLSTVEVPAAWAFSFWGGDFYLYTAPDPMNDPGRTTNVTHYSPATNTVDTSYMTDIGFTIVGAGVSTCAPITPPT